MPRLFGRAGFVLAGGVILFSVPAPAGETMQDPERCLALTLFWEAGNEGRAGMEAVAAVVLNRVEHPEFPDTVCGVVKEGGETPPCQFSWWCDGRSDRPDTSDDSWQLAHELAEKLLEDPPDDPTDKAIYFHAVGVDSPWHSDRPRTAEIGEHVFYR